MKTEARSYLVIRITEKLDERAVDAQGFELVRFASIGALWTPICPGQADITCMKPRIYIPVPCALRPSAMVAAGRKQGLCDGQAGNNIKRIT